MSEPISFSGEILRYGLLIDDYVVALLDENFTTKANQEATIQITGGEIVKIIGDVEFTMIREIKSLGPRDFPVDSKSMARYQENAKIAELQAKQKPFEVKFTENVQPLLKSISTIKTIVFFDKRGTLMDMDLKLSRADQILFANNYKWVEVIGEFKMETELSNMVYHYRSVVSKK